MTLSARINTPVEQHRRECTKLSVFHCKTVRASRLSSCSHICHTRHTQIQRECKAVKADRDATACNNAAVRCSVLVRKRKKLNVRKRCKPRSAQTQLHVVTGPTSSCAINTPTRALTCSPHVGANHQVIMTLSWCAGHAHGTTAGDELVHRQGLGHAVSHNVLCADVLEADLCTRCALTDKVVQHINVL